jgi:hypothetical protein
MKTFGKVMGIVCILACTSIIAGADDFFVDFQGPTEISFGPLYTYSVEVRGEYDDVKWSATGGEVKREWWEGSRFFCEVQWVENKADDPAKLKVYGQRKGSDEVLAQRLFVTVGGKSRSLAYKSLQNGGGKCLDVAAEELTQNGGTVQIWECNGSIQQQWKIDGAGHLVNAGGKCLDVNAPDLLTDGGKVQVWDCIDADQQKWTLSDEGTLVSEGGKCLDVNAPDINSDGGKVQIWECLDDVLQQQWKWVDASTK